MSERRQKQRRYRKRFPLPMRRTSRQTVEQRNRAARRIHSLVIRFPKLIPMRVSLKGTIVHTSQ